MRKFLLAIILMIICPLISWGAFISYPQFQVFDDLGAPLSGGLVNTYNAGTVVAKTTYSDAAMTVPNANPVVLDTRGEADIYCSGLVKLVITTSTGVAVIDQDNFSGRDDTILQDADGDTLVQVEESSDEDIIRFDCGGAEQVTIQNGLILPTTTNDIDLGSATKLYKNAYITNLYASVNGFVQRPKFVRTDGNTLTIGPGVYHHKGTTTQTVYWNANITFELGSDGSNLASDGTQADLGVAGFHYIYIDDSAVITRASPLLDAGCFINDTTAPAWRPAAHGWYGSDSGGTAPQIEDRCIMVVSTGDTEMKEFLHDGGNYITYVNHDQDVTIQDVDNTFVDIEAALSIPTFAVGANITIMTDDGNTAGMLSWKTKGQSSTTGHFIHYQDTDIHETYSVIDVITNSAQLIQLKYAGADSTNVVDVYTNGWYFPSGM